MEGYRSTPLFLLVFGLQGLNKPGNFPRQYLSVLQQIVEVDLVHVADSVGYVYMRSQLTGRAFGNVKVSQQLGKCFPFFTLSYVAGDGNCGSGHLISKSKVFAQLSFPRHGVHLGREIAAFFPYFQILKALRLGSLLHTDAPFPPFPLL